MPKKQYPCFLCERLYAEMEEAEVCEQSHEQPRDIEHPWPGPDDDPDIIAMKGDERRHG